MNCRYCHAIVIEPHGVDSAKKTTKICAPKSDFQKSPIVARRMTEVHRIRVFDYIPSPIVSISLHKNTLLVGRDSGYVEIWTIKNYVHCMCSFQATTPKDIRVVLWTKFQGKRAFAVCLLSGEVYIYNYPSLQVVAQTPSFAGAIWGAAVNSEQTHLAIACDDGKVRIFSTENDFSLYPNSPTVDGRCLSVCFDNKGKIYAGDSTGHIKRFDINSDMLEASFDVKSNESSISSEVSVWALAYTIDGCIASGDSNGHVVIWDPETSTVKERFDSHQADVLALATNGPFLYAGGIDPTVVTFQLDEDGSTWVQRGQKRFHTHDVTSIAAEGKHVVSAGMDATFFVKSQLYMPFQSRQPIAASVRAGGEIVAVGAESNILSVWRFDGESASLELRIKTRDVVEAVAVSKDGLRVAYSNDTTRVLRYDVEKAQWAYDGDAMPKATALAFSDSGDLFLATLSGEVIGPEGSRSLGFPLFLLAVAGDGSQIAAGGLKRLVALPGGDLQGPVSEVPYLGTPASAIAFQPGKKRLFIASGGKKVVAYHVRKQKLIPRFSVGLGKQKEGPAVHTISFDPVCPDRVLLMTSGSAVVANLAKRELGKYRLPYEDFLFGAYVCQAALPPKKEEEKPKEEVKEKPKKRSRRRSEEPKEEPKEEVKEEVPLKSKLVVYEKPWAFMAHNLPMPFRVKRFQGSDETKRPRY